MQGLELLQLSCGHEDRACLRRGPAWKQEELGWMCERSLHSDLSPLKQPTWNIQFCELTNFCFS